ncbi:MAG: matrixin family metalloprotease [Methanosarcinaceae archaeon]|nr:matrixin family metalloprotease [Methanosarcinaceae archaeon]
MSKANFISQIVLLVLVVASPVASSLDNDTYPKILEMPWDHSPITVFIDDKNVPPHYSPTYLTQVEKALEYWEEGGNGKLNFTPVFEIVETHDADITIKWVENLEEVIGAPEGVAGFCRPYILNEKCLRVEIVLEVGNFQGFSWLQYGDSNMHEISKHEIGHALGLAHSNDKHDIMYPTYEQRDNLNPLLLESTLPFLIIGSTAALIVVGFLFTSWRLHKRKREQIEQIIFGEEDK